MKTFNCSLYVILDLASLKHRSASSVAKAAIAGGATMLQLRDKRGSTSKILSVGHKLKTFTETAGIPFIINDRVDVALAIDADGVHLGQDDMPILLARNLLGGKTIVGASVKTIAQAKKAQDDGADYLGVGPIFKTGSKSDAGSPIGLTSLSKIAKSVSIPVVAIGGITVKNARDVMKTGASGIAVISAILKAKDPERATRELRIIADNRR